MSRRGHFDDINKVEPVGERTRIFREAYSAIQDQLHQLNQQYTRERRLFFIMILTLSMATIIAVLFAIRLREENLRQRAIARDIFYSMKTLDLKIAEAERQSLTSNNPQRMQVMADYENRRQEMRKSYDQCLASLHVYDPKSTERHRLVMRVARIFGECELDMPSDFEKEVSRYIDYWRSSGRFSRDIKLAQEKGYIQSISHALLAEGLPAQFVYLAMQESDFDMYASGPVTRVGIAKGMWQFVPETAVKYGLHLGPQVDLRRPDTQDDRDQVEKSTIAASRYLQMLYSTDAQASGLLVMACYNWGEAQVLPLVRSMPKNPSERNFWHLLAQHRDQIPQQTYDYVFYITAAAVIGENPRLFGFDFDNPLENVR
jgi:hypothetical protein